MRATHCQPAWERPDGIASAEAQCADNAAEMILGRARPLPDSMATLHKTGVSARPASWLYRLRRHDWPLKFTVASETDIILSTDATTASCDDLRDPHIARSTLNRAWTDWLPSGGVCYADFSVQRVVYPSDRSIVVHSV